MRKVICIILTCIICSFSVLCYADELTNLQSEHDTLQNQIDETNEELSSVQDELSKNLQQVQKLDEKIESSEKEIQELTEKIEKLQAAIEIIEEKLKIAQENYDKQEEVLEARLIAMYEAGDTRISRCCTKFNKCIRLSFKLFSNYRNSYI